jgi:hypothetical protein
MMTQNYDRRLKKRPLDTKTDLATGVDEHWHLVFKIPAKIFMKRFGGVIEDFDKVRELVHSLGCNAELENIVGIDIAEIDDAYFGIGVQIVVHESIDPYQSKCHKCKLHFDMGES